MTEKEAYILKGFKGFVKLVHEGGSTCLLSAVKICGHQDGVRCDQLEQATIVLNQTTPRHYKAYTRNEYQTCRLKKVDKAKPACS